MLVDGFPGQLTLFGIKFGQKWLWTDQLSRAWASINWTRARKFILTYVYLIAVFVWLLFPRWFEVDFCRQFYFNSLVVSGFICRVFVSVRGWWNRRGKTWTDSYTPTSQKGWLRWWAATTSIGGRWGVVGAQWYKSTTTGAFKVSSISRSKIFYSSLITNGRPSSISNGFHGFYAVKPVKTI